MLVAVVMVLLLLLLDVLEFKPPRFLLVWRHLFFQLSPFVTPPHTGAANYSGKQKGRLKSTKGLKAQGGESCCV